MLQGLGEFAGEAWSNLKLSGAMYGVYGTMTYDAEHSDVFNHSVKMGGGFAIDQVQDLTIMAAGSSFSSAYKGSRLAGSVASTSSRMIKAGEEAFSLGKELGAFSRIGGAIKGFSGVGLKGLGWAAEHSVGVGLGAVGVLGMMGMDFATMAISAYDQLEGDYRRKRHHPHYQLSQSSASFVQNQLQRLQYAENQAEFMHN